MDMYTAKQLIGGLLDRGFTRSEIAAQAGVSVSTVARVYTGEYADIDYMPGKRIELMFSKHKRKKSIRGELAP